MIFVILELANVFIIIKHDWFSRNCLYGVSYCPFVQLTYFSSVLNCEVLTIPANLCMRTKSPVYVSEGLLRGLGSAQSTRVYRQIDVTGGA